MLCNGPWRGSLRKMWIRWERLLGRPTIVNRAVKSRCKSIMVSGCIEPTYICCVFRKKYIRAKTSLMGAFPSERSQEWTFTYCIMEYQLKPHSVGFSHLSSLLQALVASRLETRITLVRQSSLRRPAVTHRRLWAIKQHFPAKDYLC